MAWAAPRQSNVCYSNLHVQTPYMESLEKQDPKHGIQPQFFTHPDLVIYLGKPEFATMAELTECVHAAVSARVEAFSQSHLYEQADAVLVDYSSSNGVFHMLRLDRYAIPSDACTYHSGNCITFDYPVVAELCLLSCRVASAFS